MLDTGGYNKILDEVVKKRNFYKWEVTKYICVNIKSPLIPLLTFGGGWPVFFLVVLFVDLVPVGGANWKKCTGLCRLRFGNSWSWPYGCFRRPGSRSVWTSRWGGRPPWPFPFRGPFRFCPSPASPSRRKGCNFSAPPQSLLTTVSASSCANCSSPVAVPSSTSSVPVATPSALCCRTARNSTR